MQIELADGMYAEARYITHLGIYDDDDMDLYRLPDGREVIATSPTCDSTRMPREMAGYHVGPAGVTPDEASR